jgi:hypothetical protein
MRRAVGFTLAALSAASDIDRDRTDEDRAFFNACEKKLEAVAQALRSSDDAVELYDLTEGIAHQVAVALGDAVLDRGVRNAATQTQAALRSKAALGLSDVFGTRVAELTAAPLRVEPRRVIEAAERLDDLPDFEKKTAIQKDLVARAETLETLIEELDRGHAKRHGLQGACVRAVAEGADALAAIRAELEQRFPRQREYVTAFFLDVAAPK